MIVIELRTEDFDVFKEVQVKPRWDWPACFSTNSRGERWPGVTHELTLKPTDYTLTDSCPSWTRLSRRTCFNARRVVVFFLSDQGAFYRDIRGQTHQLPAVFSMARPLEPDA